MTITPRLTLTCMRGGDDPTAIAREFIRACAQEQLEVGVLLVGADRDVPAPEAVAQIVRETGHAVHRLDPRVMPIPSIQHVTAKAAAGVDVLLVLALLPFGEAIDVEIREVLDVLHAIDGPVALGALPGGESRRTLQRIEELLRRHGPPGTDPIVLRAADSVPGAKVFVRLLERARAASPLPPPIVHSRRARRARVGLILDECFDLYDEESLVQFEVAGAELVPISAIGGSPDDLADIDGLLVGDGHVERYSAELARARRFRGAVRAALGRGMPALAAGGGQAYLTRGLRTTSGALHPFAGVIAGEAVVVAGPLPHGHVEVATRRETLIGPAGTKLRGFVQRAWLLRGTHASDRAVYATCSGPADEGYATGNILALHFRPYWPSCHHASRFFVDRCVSFAASCEFGERGAGRAGDTSAS